MRIRRPDTARWRHLPVGFRDQTVDEAAARRRLEARLREVFARWGYAEVLTPTLEFLDTFLQGAGPGVADLLLKMVDSGGEVLALRPEMTVPLARFAATRLLPAGPGPLRLAYIAAVFRGQERGSGQLREFTQAGVELIGEAGPEADVEVIALAADALHAAGLTRPAISVGHAGFVRGMLATLPDETAEIVRDRLYRRAFADLDGVMAGGPVRDALRQIPTLRGEHALERAGALAVTSESREALQTLRDVLDGVKVHMPAVRVEVDLGLIRDFEYYSGTVFEAHAGRAGLPLLGGGRYDGLLARFGRAAPATGFAIGLERVLEAGEGHAEPRPMVVVRYRAGGYGAAVQAARGLRGIGLSVVMAPVGARAGIDEPVCTVTVAASAVTIAFDGREMTVAPDAVVQVVREGLEQAS
ncbi:MAG: ATP phosphoribosyltransferase regulatory subunit [Armatimonadota bacterium]